MKLEILQKSQQSQDVIMERLWQAYWGGEMPIDRSISKLKICTRQYRVEPAHTALDDQSSLQQ